MVARRRRALSNSTVATVDEATVPYFRESSVLKKVPLSTVPDDWPCILLVDATIYDRHGHMANQLSVDLDGPFIIRGRLALEKDQDNLLVARPGKCRDAFVQIENSASFAVGLKEEDNGPPLPVLWASGEAGWYEIVPSERYKPIGTAMFQAIALYYSVADQYDNAFKNLPAKKRGKKKSRADVQFDINEVLFKFAVQEGEGLTLPEALKRCDDNAVFFLSHFKKSLQFYKWLASKHPDVVRKLAEKEALAEKKAHDNGPVIVPGLEAADPADPRYRAKSGSHDVAAKSRRSRALSRDQSIGSSANADTKPVELSRRPKRKSPPSRSDVEMQESPQTAQTTQTAKIGLEAVLDALEDEKKDVIEAARVNPRGKPFKEITASSWHTRVYMQCSIAKHHGGREVCEYFAKDLVERLGREWYGSKIYEWAKENVDTVPAYENITEDKIISLVRRQKKPRPSAADSAPPRTPIATSGGKQLPHPGRTGGKQSGLRPVWSKKRPRDLAGSDDEMDIDSDDVDQQQQNHKNKKSRLLNGGKNAAHGSDSSSSDEEGDVILDSSPLRKLVVTAETLPSTFATGPNSTWTCEEPDCGFIVRGADDDEGQEQINAHYEEHEKAAREMMQEMELSRINLAMQESKKGHMPIDHLLEKIRSLGGEPALSSSKEPSSTLTAAAQSLTNGGGDALPRPIKRSLLI